MSSPINKSGDIPLKFSKSSELWKYAIELIKDFGSLKFKENRKGIIPENYQELAITLLQVGIVVCILGILFIYITMCIVYALVPAINKIMLMESRIIDSFDFAYCKFIKKTLGGVIQEFNISTLVFCSVLASMIFAAIYFLQMSDTLRPAVYMVFIISILLTVFNIIEAVIVSTSLNSIGESRSEFEKEFEKMIDFPLLRRLYKNKETQSSSSNEEKSYFTKSFWEKIKTKDASLISKFFETVDDKNGKLNGFNLLEMVLINDQGLFRDVFNINISEYSEKNLNYMEKMEKTQVLFNKYIREIKSAGILQLLMVVLTVTIISYLSFSSVKTNQTSKSI
jgi:hypothetical protein